MWKQITEKEQIALISLGAILLKYPTNEIEVISPPIGNEKNSDSYKVISLQSDTLQVQFLLPTSGSTTLPGTTMKRYVSYQQLLNGTWWLNV